MWIHLPFNKWNWHNTWKISSVPIAMYTCFELQISALNVIVTWTYWDGLHTIWWMSPFHHRIKLLDLHYYNCIIYIFRVNWRIMWGMLSALGVQTRHLANVMIVNWVSKSWNLFLSKPSQMFVAKSAKKTKEHVERVWVRSICRNIAVNWYPEQLLSHCVYMCA